MTTVTKIRIENFGGIEAFELEPGNLTVLTGENGAGKTAVLEAIRAALTNHRERTVLVHDDAGNGRLLFELSNGMVGERGVTNAGTTAGVMKLRQEGNAVKSGESVLQEMVGGSFGLNPVAFLFLSDGDQRDEILKVTKVDLPYDEAIRLSAGERRDGINYDAHPLELLKAIEDSLYFARREVNRDATHRRHAAGKLREAVRGEVDQSLLSGFDLEEAITKLTRAQDVGTQIASKERRVGEIQAQMNMLSAEWQRVLPELEHLKSQQVDPAPIRADIETFKTQQDDWRKIQQANDEDGEAERLELRAQGMTELIEEVRNKPAELLQDADLPIDGLEITDDGTITVNGRVIGDLSTGEKLAQVAVPIALATMPTKEDGMQILLVDGLETLDAKNRQQMLRTICDAGIQVLATEVREGELTVITDYMNGLEI